MLYLFWSYKNYNCSLSDCVMFFTIFFPDKFSNDNCYLNTTVSGTLLEMYMSGCSFCNEHGKRINFLKIHMVDLGCGHGNLKLDFGPEVPLDHVNLYERLISMGSDSNLTSCFKLQSVK